LGQNVIPIFRGESETNAEEAVLRSFNSGKTVVVSALKVKYA
jgi:hypothetical protein